MTSELRRRLAVTGVWLFAVVLRLPHLVRPRVLVFDEIFYAPDAADLLRWGSEHGQPAHPSLGKWLMAGGIRIFGFTPFGWRIGSVLAGAAICATVAWVAIRLCGRIAHGVAAGSLVAFDGLVHVTSRLALLDAFVAAFTTGAVAACVAAWLAQPDRDRARRCWWWAVGTMSLGAAVKWSALAVAPLVLGVGWAIAGRLEAPGRPRIRRRVVVAAAVLLLPLAALGASVVPRQLGPDRIGPGDHLAEQADVVRFHRDLRPTNSNAAPAWTWAVQSHPANLLRATCPLEPKDSARITDPRPTAGTELRSTVVGDCPNGEWVVRIVAGSNPVVWGLGLLGVAAVLVGALRRREDAALLLAAVAAVWLPWLLSPRRSYSFYAVAVVPIMVMTAAWGLSLVPRRWHSRLVPSAVGLAGLGFVVLWPVWSGWPISPDHARWITRWPGWG